MTPDLVVLLATFPEEDSAARIAGVLVSEQLVACVNVLPAVNSIYRWQGVVTSAREVLAVMKTRADLVDAVISRVKELHPYDVPEVIALPVVAGLPAYLQWVMAETIQESVKGSVP